MTEVWICCTKCHPEKIKDDVKARKYVISEGQTHVWACIHVRSFQVVYPKSFKELKI